MAADSSHHSLMLEFSICSLAFILKAAILVVRSSLGPWDIPAMHPTPDKYDENGT